MISWRRLLTAIIGGLLVTAGVRADMAPIYQRDAGHAQLLRACRLTELRYTNLSSPYNRPSVAELDLWPVGFFPDAKVDVSQTSDIQHPITLTNGSGSLNLCLSALIGLGLCSSAHCVKKLHLGFVPEWYHNGGPFQIGHSYAVTPESLCPAPAFCFIQPTCTAEDISPEYYKGTIGPLLRKSLFTPNVLDPRGPPLRSC